MKKSKILIPALSIASVGAVVAPIVTSCSNKVVFSTNDIDYKSDKVAATTTAIDANTMVKDYMKDSKHLIQDCAYSGMVMVNVQITGYKDKPNFKLLESNVTINNLNVGSEKSVTLPGETNKTTGYLVSGSLNIQIKYSYDDEISSNDGETIKSHVVETSATFNFNDILLYFTYTTEDIHWNGNFYALKDASTNWKVSMSAVQTETTTIKYENGATETTTLTSNHNEANQYNEECEDYEVDKFGIYAYSFNDVLGKE